MKNDEDVSNWPKFEMAFKKTPLNVSYVPEIIFSYLYLGMHSFNENNVYLMQINFKVAWEMFHMLSELPDSQLIPKIPILTIKGRNGKHVGPRKDRLCALASVDQGELEMEAFVKGVKDIGCDLVKINAEVDVNHNKPYY